jgi:hypothetical protein
VWGLLQAGILANKLLCKQLAPHGYYERKHIPGLWKHETQPILFTLVVVKFGVKYVNKDNVNHLIKCLKQKYKLTEDWEGNLYCGIKVSWNYNNHTLEISMPGYIIKHQKYKKYIARQTTTLPVNPQTRQYGSNGQHPLPLDTSPSSWTPT